MVLNIKYQYVLLIATDNYKESLVAQINKLYDVPCSTVIVANGKDSAYVFDKYIQTDLPENCSLWHSNQKGKSNALNHFLKTVSNPDIYIVFTDDDIVFPKETLIKHIAIVEKYGKGYFFGGGVDVVLEKELPLHLYNYYPDSIKGLSEEKLAQNKQFLGCNWGAFASDLKKAGYFDPLYGPGSKTNATGQERVMMNQLLDMGIKSVVIANARVTHVAPQDCHTEEWLFERFIRNSIKYGLQRPHMLLLTIPYKFIVRIFSHNFRRKVAHSELLGLIKAVKFLFMAK